MYRSGNRRHQYQEAERKAEPMRWSKLKQLTEERMSPALAGRVALYSTRYPKAYDGDVLGRGWITIDGREIVNFCDYTQEVQLYRRSELDPSSDYCQQLASLQAEGVLDRGDFYRVLWTALSMSIDDLLASDNILHRALAMTDRRLGKRRLKKLTVNEDEHPLVRELYALRCEVEGIRAPLGTAQ
jgi:hypothetical protein